MVSLAALRWLADQDAAFVMLERDGQVLAHNRPGSFLGCPTATRPGAGRAFRSRLAHRAELISQKACRAGTWSCATSCSIRHCRDRSPTSGAEVDKAETMDAIRWLESQGAVGVLVRVAGSADLLSRRTISAVCPITGGRLTRASHRCLDRSGWPPIRLTQS